jgi:hypothetical protein
VAGVILHEEGRGTSSGAQSIDTGLNPYISTDPTPKHGTRQVRQTEVRLTFGKSSGFRWRQ